MSKPSQSSPVVVAAAIRPGYRVAYSVMIGDKEILSRGTVFDFRRVGHNRAEITLMHDKTGSLFTNVVKGNSPVQLSALTFDPTADPLAEFLVQQLQAKLTEQASDFYSILPIQD